MDANGDGRTDLLRLMRDLSSNLTSCGTQTHLLFLSNGDGSFTTKGVTGISFQQTASTRIERYNCLIPPSDTYISACSEWGNVYFGTAQTVGYNYHLLDVNADGFMDIVTTMLPGFGGTMSPPTDAETCANIVCTRVFLGSSTGTFSEQTNTNLARRSVYAPPARRSGPSFARAPFVGDVNGDGLADLMVDNGVWLSRGDGNFDVDPTIPNGVNCAYSGDFNNDGRMDCLGVTISAASQSLRIADGTYARKETANFNLNSAGHELLGLTSSLVQHTGIALLDGFDGVHTAILRWKDDPAQNRIYVANGDGTFRRDGTFNLTASTHGLAHSNGLTSFELGDFTGKGQLAILQLKHGAASGGAPNQLYLRSDPTPADQLLSVKSSTGSVTTLTYESLPTSSRYTSDRGTGSAAQYPKVDITPPMLVVTRLTADAGVGALTNTTEYAYAGLKMTYSGRGVLGFREVLQQNAAPNGDPVTVYTRYLQDHPYQGVASYTETRRGTLAETGARRLSATANVYCEVLATVAQRDAAALDSPCNSQPKVARPYLRSSTESGWDLADIALPTVTTANTFNGFGDLTAVDVTTTGMLAGSEQSFTKRTSNVFCEPGTANCPNRTDGDNWILGRLQRAEVRQTATNSLPVLTAPTPLAVAIVPSNTLTLRASSVGPVSGGVTVNVSGGAGPYSFVWTRLSGSRVSVSGGQMASFSASANYEESFTEGYRVTVTDSAGASVAGTLDITVVGPYRPPAAAVSPTSHAFNSVSEGETKSVTITVSNTGGPGAVTISLDTAETSFRLSRGTCPANGVALGASASCTVTVFFDGAAQCGGLVVVRRATLNVTIANPSGTSSASVPVTAQHRVYKLTDPPCR